MKQTRRDTYPAMIEEVVMKGKKANLVDRCR